MGHDWLVGWTLVSQKVDVEMKSTMSNLLKSRIMIPMILFCVGSAVLYMDTLLKFPVVGCLLCILFYVFWKDSAFFARFRILCVVEMIIWLFIMTFSLACVSSRIGSFNNCVMYESIGGVPPQNPSPECISILQNVIVGRLVSVKYFTTSDKLNYYVVIDAMPYLRMHWLNSDQHWEFSD